MKVFISWSGDLSLQIALIFRDWLPSVIQSIEPYVSSEDIDKGARWSTDIARELENSTFGILCVTKANFEAPWLSFEAGALSKTMDKSLVTPFLFDIKRSEVKGPILQFQSTIFQKDDIKKMMKTLNTACGETGITEQQLDKTFEVWYPTLEQELNKIKEEYTKLNDDKDDNKEIKPAEILEEILELSRDNQKLLKNPDMNTSDLLNLEKELKKSIYKGNADIMNFLDTSKFSKKYKTMFFEELMYAHVEKENLPYHFLIILSFFKNDFPWLYDSGKELLETLKKEKSEMKKREAIQSYKNIINFTCKHPLMNEIYGPDTKFLRDIISNCIEDLKITYL